MKIIKIIFIILVTIVILLSIVLGIGVYLASQYLDPQQIKPQIEELLKEALGREVQIKDLSMMVSFGQGIRIEVKDFEISDVPEFSHKPILNVSMMRLSLQLLPLLQRRQILVSEIIVENPRINIVRDEKRNFNILGFDFLKQAQNQGSDSHRAQSAENTQAAGNALGALSGLLIRDVHLRNGSIYFEDHTGEVGPSAFLTSIDFSVNNVSIIQPFDFLLKAAVLGQAQNFSLEGRAQIDLANLLVYVRDLNARWDLSMVSAERINGLSSALEVLDIRDPVRGIVSGNIRVAQISSEGVSGLISDVLVQDGSFYSSRLKVPVEKVNATLHLNNENARLDEASFYLGSGIISSKGVIKDYMNRQEYDLSLEIEEIDIAQVLDQAGQEVELQGFLNAQASVKGKDMMSLVIFQPETAKGRISLKDGQLKNINVLNLVLQRVDAIPGLLDQLLMHLPQKYQDQLRQKNTPLSSLVVSSFIQDKKIHLDEISIKSEGFILEGQGTMDFSLTGKMQTQIMIEQDLSEAMVKSVAQLEFLTDNDGRIVFPLQVSGRFPDRLSFSPDLQNIGRNLLETRGRQELQRILGRVLGQDNNELDPDAKQDNLSTEAQEERTPVDQIIDNFFGIIFR